MLSIYVKDKDRIYPLFSLIISTLFFIVGLFFVKEPWFVFYMLAIVLVLIGFGFYKSLFKVSLLIIPFSVLVYLLALLGTSHINALQNSYRALLLGLASVISLSIEPVDLVRNLNALKVPRLLSLGLLISLRFIGVIAEEMKRIRIAMQTRGVNNNYLNPKVLYRAFFIPLIMRVISISDILAVSLDTRGFKSDAKHSNFKEVTINFKSILFFIVSISILAFALYLHFFDKGAVLWYLK